MSTANGSCVDNSTGGNAHPVSPTATSSPAKPTAPERPDANAKLSNHRAKTCTPQQSLFQPTESNPHRGVSRDAAGLPRQRQKQESRTAQLHPAMTDRSPQTDTQQACAT